MSHEIYRWHPLSPEEVEGEHALRIRSPAEPIAILGPPGCRLVEAPDLPEEGWELVAPVNPRYGWCAYSAVHMALCRERGFRLDLDRETDFPCPLSISTPSGSP